MATTQPHGEWLFFQSKHLTNNQSQWPFSKVYYSYLHSIRPLLKTLLPKQPVCEGKSHTTSSAYIFLPAGWQRNTQSSSVLDRSQASRCGEWRTSTWCRSLRTCTADFTPVTPTSSSTPSNNAPETCSMTFTSGWVSAGKTLHLKDDEAL